MNEIKSPYDLLNKYEARFDPSGLNKTNPIFQKRACNKVDDEEDN